MYNVYSLHTGRFIGEYTTLSEAMAKSAGLSYTIKKG